MTKKKQRETRLWQFDPSVFQPGPKASMLERFILRNARSIGKHGLYALAFAYPIILVTLGVVFGGLVFWTSLVGSMALFWLVIKRAGYSGNFASWDMGYKSFLGLGAAFGIYAALIYGLIHIGLWVVPIFGGILIIALVLGIKIKSNQ